MGEVVQVTSTALMILNPRDIPYCMDALRALTIPKCWISYVPEIEAAVRINEQIAATHYDRYVIISDDCEPYQEALDLVLAWGDRGHDVVTGYSNFDKFLPFVNLCWNRLHPPPPLMDSYKFLTRAEVDAMPLDKPIMTTFAGLSFTMMTRELWARFPMHTTAFGGQMDYQLSFELQQKRVPIIAAPGAFVKHHKDKFGVYPDASPEKQLLLGERPPAVTWTGVPE